MASVRTVLGETSPDELGITLRARREFDLSFHVGRMV